MSNPLMSALEFMQSYTGLPTDSTFSTSFPDAVPQDRVHVQFAWDGTPSDADNREDTAVRFTVWAHAYEVTLPQDEAATLRATLLRYSSDEVWRVDRGAGRLPGVDPDTGLQFCTFTVQFVMHQVAPL